MSSANARQYAEYSPVVAKMTEPNNMEAMTAANDDCFWLFLILLGLWLMWRVK